MRTGIEGIAKAWRAHGRWYIELELPFWVVTDMASEAEQRALFRVSSTEITAPSGPSDPAHLTLELTDTLS